MKKIIDELSVFFPAYNEEENIEKTVLDTKKVLERIAAKWEIIIVDDGSKDNTGKISDRLAKNNNIEVIHHKPNRGYGGALKSGYKKSKYEFVAFMDSDGQFRFSDVTKLINLQQKTGADLVLGIRKNRADPIIRKVYTYIWSYLLPRFLFGLKVRDYSCGFKLIKKEVFNAVQPLVGEEKVTQIEILTKAQRQGFKFAEIGVNHYSRRHGEATGANIKVVTKSVVSLIKLWKTMN
jgi:glycosyltransferase involved in cell wall biosynthesis